MLKGRSHHHWNGPVGATRSIDIQSDIPPKVSADNNHIIPFPQSLYGLWIYITSTYAESNRLGVKPY